jgi:pimeloyl-ACP methyl ester carboxylesterase
MRLRRIIGRSLALTAAAGLGASPMTAPALAADEETSTVDWGACPEDVATTVPLECATLAVPLDHREPDGTTIDVMISRLASANPEERRGVLLLNPGGPGGSGLAQPAQLHDLGIPDSVLDAYDLIGMDPRGVGHSSPVSCGFTADQDYRGNLPPYAPDEAAVAAQAEAAEAIAAQCAANDTEGLMPYMTTANTARDMDAIRAALGEEQISFFGASYGSALGSAYASLFPERSDRIVIDSNLGDTTIGHEGQRLWGLGVEDAFPDFADWAAQRHGSYGLGETAEEVREHYFALAERLDEEPVAGVDGALFRFVVFGGLYSERRYAPSAQFWQSVAASDEQAVREQLEEHGLAPQDSSAPSPHDNAWSSYLAVTCNDTDWPEDVAVYQDAVAEDRERYPMFGAAGANVSPCAFWHNEPIEPKVPIDDEGPRNVLVMQHLRDVATPYAGGLQAREAFGDRAALVTVDGNGHGVYVYGENACALNTATRYLVDGQMPDSDVFCAASTASDLDREAQQRRAEVLDGLTW